MRLLAMQKMAMRIEYESSVMILFPLLRAIFGVNTEVFICYVGFAFAEKQIIFTEHVHGCSCNSGLACSCF
jgi:hypothetical protein